MADFTSQQLGYEYSGPRDENGFPDFNSPEYSRWLSQNTGGYLSDPKSAVPENLSFLAQDPDFYAMSEEEKRQTVAVLSQLPAETINTIAQAYPTTTTPASTDTTTTSTPGTTTQASTSKEQQVRDAFKKYLNREPTGVELDNFVNMLNNGENIDMKLRQLPEAAANGFAPSWGEELGGQALPEAPNITNVPRPEIPTLTNYGSDVNGMSLPTYGEDMEGLGLKKYGDEAGGLSPVKYGDTVAGLGLRQYGDTVGGLKPVNYGDEINGLGLTKYGKAIDGKAPVTFGDTVAGYSPVQYDDIVTDPVNAWRYEETPAFKAKNEIAQEALNNSLAARGILRGANAAMGGADLTRKLYAEDYDKERATFIQQAMNRYQAKGADYKTAYQAAQNEYDTLYNRRNEQYNTAYTSSDANYKAALQNAQAQYAAAYGAGTAEYAAALKDWQAQYDKIYGSKLANYSNAVNSANTNAGLNYTAQNNQYESVKKDILAQYGIDLDKYTRQYTNQGQEATNAYNQILDLTKIGLNASGTVANAGTSSTQGAAGATGTAGAAAGNAALGTGQTNAAYQTGLGSIIPNIMSAYDSGSKWTWGGNSGTDTGTSGSSPSTSSFSVDFSKPIKWNDLEG